MEIANNTIVNMKILRKSINSILKKKNAFKMSLKVNLIEMN